MPPLPLRAGFGRCDAYVGCSGSSMKSPVPGCEHELGFTNSQGAGKVNGVGSPQRMQAGELPGVALNGGRQLDGPYGGPVLLPGLFGCRQAFLIEVMVTTGRGQGGTDFGVREAAGKSGVATVPQFSRQSAADFLDEQLHQRAGVEVDKWHRVSAAVRSPDRTLNAADEVVNARSPLSSERARGGRSLRPRPSAPESRLQ